MLTALLIYMVLSCKSSNQSRTNPCVAVPFCRSKNKPEEIDLYGAVSYSIAVSYSATIQAARSWL